jgi:DNA-binding MarR family transcriptional regulator
MLKELNPLLHGEQRLGIMSILISVDRADFTYIRKETGATADNLSVQLEKLSQAGYITIEEGFQGKMPRTACHITKEGLKAFKEYVEVLQAYIVKK